MGVVSSRKKLSLSTGQEGVKHGLMNHGLWPTRSPYVIPISYLHENHHHKKEIDTNREQLLGESVDSFSRSQRLGGSMPRRAAAVLGAHSD